jgi:DNA-binding NarL/FixJ family response regulator
VRQDDRVRLTNRIATAGAGSAPSIGPLVNSLGRVSPQPAAQAGLPGTAVPLQSAGVIRVAILSDSRLLYEGLRRILDDPSLVVVGDPELAAGGEVVGASAPHILLVDVRGDGTLAQYPRLPRNGARPWMILLQATADEESAVQALASGARGILLKTASAEDLIKAIRVVHEGQIWASNAVMARVVEWLATRTGVPRAMETFVAQRLSRREHEVVRHTAGGLSNQEVADQLGISEATVKAHLTRVFVKLGVRDRAQLTTLYYRGLSANPKENVAAALAPPERHSDSTPLASRIRS